MKTVQQIIDELLMVEDKSQSCGIFCGGRYSDIGEVTSDDEGVYLEPEEKN
jgi:hypothetical protein